MPFSAVNQKACRNEPTGKRVQVIFWRQLWAWLRRPQGARRAPISIDAQKLTCTHETVCLHLRACLTWVFHMPLQLFHTLFDIPQYLYI